MNVLKIIILHYKGGLKSRFMGSHAKMGKFLASLFISLTAFGFGALPEALTYYAYPEEPVMADSEEVVVINKEGPPQYEDQLCLPPATLSLSHHFGREG